MELIKSRKRRPFDLHLFNLNKIRVTRGKKKKKKKRKGKKKEK